MGINTALQQVLDCDVSMNQAHNLPTGSGVVWIHPPYLDKADYTGVTYPRFHLNCPAMERGSLEKTLIGTISWAQNHLVSIDANPSLHKSQLKLIVPD